MANPNIPDGSLVREDEDCLWIKGAADVFHDRSTDGRRLIADHCYARWMQEAEEYKEIVSLLLGCINSETIHAWHAIDAAIYEHTEAASICVDYASAWAKWGAK